MWDTLSKIWKVPVPVEEKAETKPKEQGLVTLYQTDTPFERARTALKVMGLIGMISEAKLAEVFQSYKNLDEGVVPCEKQQKPRTQYQYKRRPKARKVRA